MKLVEWRWLKGFTTTRLQHRGEILGKEICLQLALGYCPNYPGSLDTINGDIFGCTYEFYIDFIGPLPFSPSLLLLVFPVLFLLIKVLLVDWALVSHQGNMWMTYGLLTNTSYWNWSLWYQNKRSGPPVAEVEFFSKQSYVNIVDDKLVSKLSS